MRVIHSLREFVALESAGGILLAIAAAAALALANSPLAFLYDAFLATPVEGASGHCRSPSRCCVDQRRADGGVFLPGGP